MSGISYSHRDIMHRDYFATYGESAPPHPATLEREIQQGKWDSREPFRIDVPDTTQYTGSCPRSEADWREFYKHTIEDSIARDGRIPAPQTIKNLKQEVVPYTISQTSQRLRAEPEFHAIVKEAREEAANPFGPIKRFVTGEKSPYDEAMTEGSYRHRFGFGIENDGSDPDFLARLKNPPSQKERIRQQSSTAAKKKFQPASYRAGLKRASQAADYGLDGINALTEDNASHHLTKAGTLVVNHLDPAGGVGQLITATAPAAHALGHFKGVVLGPLLPPIKAWNTNRVVSRDLERQIEDCAVQAVPHHEAWFDEAAEDVVESVQEGSWQKAKKARSRKWALSGLKSAKNRKK